MIIANIISLIVLFIGGLNWGLVGIFRFNLVEWIFGGFNAGSIVIRNVKKDSIVMGNPAREMIIPKK